MRFLIYTDLHLKPGGSGYDLDQITVPPDVDAVLISGDLTHRAGADDKALARAFVSRLGERPIIYIPGNHDHRPMPQQVVDSFDIATSLHAQAEAFGDVTVVGYGCHQRSLTRPLDQREFERLDPAGIDSDKRRYMANQHAAQIETVCYNVICGEMTLNEAQASLDIKSHEEARFEHTIEMLTESYQELSAILPEQEPILLVTHVPPFNTSFDQHHAIGDRNPELEHLHVGSIPIKLAIRTHTVIASVSGHSHCFGYDVCQHGDDQDEVHYLNLGYRGIGTVTLNPAPSEFVFQRIAGE